MVVVGPVPELCSYHGDTRMFQHIESPVVEGVVPPSMFKDRQAHVIGLDDTRSNVHDHIREEIPSIDPMAEPARHTLLGEVAVRHLCMGRLFQMNGLALARGPSAINKISCSISIIH